MLIEQEKKSVDRVETKRFIIGAYNNVIKKILQKYKVSEKATVEKINDLGLTAHMTEKLTDFLKKKIKRDPTALLQIELTSIIGIGPKLAAKLIEAGVKKISDLKKKKFFSTLPEVSKLYIEQAPERKIPHETIRDIEKIIIGGPFDAQIVGSFRRCTKFSKDIDVMLVSDDPADLQRYIEWIRKKFTKIYLYASGKDKASFLVSFREKSYKLDVFLTLKEFAPAMLLYSTGSKEFNIRMRGIAKKQGYVLNQKGLFKNNERIKIDDERGFFAVLGMEFLKPNDR